MCASSKVDFDRNAVHSTLGNLVVDLLLKLDDLFQSSQGLWTDRSPLGFQTWMQSNKLRNGPQVTELNDFTSVMFSKNHMKHPLSKNHYCSVSGFQLQFLPF